MKKTRTLKEEDEDVEILWKSINREIPRLPIHTQCSRRWRWLDDTGIGGGGGGSCSGWYSAGASDDISTRKTKGDGQYRVKIV